MKFTEREWGMAGLGGLLVLFVIGLLLAANHGPSYHILSDSQQQTARLGAKDFAEPAGMTFLSCWGKDGNNDGTVACSMRTVHGTYEYLHCTYNQEGCLPRAYYNQKE